MSLNVSKTHLMVFTNINITEPVRISISQQPIERVGVIRFVGVLIDDKLNWTKHNKISKSLSIMCRARYTLTKSALFTIYCSLVLPYLNYCCEIWVNTYKSRIANLFILQKKAVRIIDNDDYLCHTDPIFKRYKLLKLYDLRAYRRLRP